VPQISDTLANNELKEDNEDNEDNELKETSYHRYVKELLQRHKIMKSDQEEYEDCFSCNEYCVRRTFIYSSYQSV